MIINLKIYKFIQNLTKYYIIENLAYLIIIMFKHEDHDLDGFEDIVGQENIISNNAIN